MSNGLRVDEQFPHTVGLRTHGIVGGLLVDQDLPLATAGQPVKHADDPIGLGESTPTTGVVEIRQEDARELPLFVQLGGRGPAISLSLPCDLPPSGRYRVGISFESTVRATVFFEPVAGGARSEYPVELNFGLVVNEEAG
jgi:hypothetical protein